MAKSAIPATMDPVIRDVAWQPDGWGTWNRGGDVRFSRGEGAGGALGIECGVNAPPAAWVRIFPVRGGCCYRFSVNRKVDQAGVANRATPVQVIWLDRDGRPLGMPELASDRGVEDEGSALAGSWVAHRRACGAQIELHLRWAPRSRVRWSGIRFEEGELETRRSVRLAAVHARPKGSTNSVIRESFEPLIEKAGRRGVELLCLPECITAYRSLDYAAASEPVPGPSTEYFGSLARRHDLHIVVGLIERGCGDALYNIAALIGPDGRLVGKYRKVCVPHNEAVGGIVPGTEYPVFETRFGRVGMMICWDLFFPEVARRLAEAGAEILAVPIWGGDSLLARARSVENHVVLLTSTYEERPGRRWMRSAIWDRRGDALARSGRRWGRLVVADVDFARDSHWERMGDISGRLQGDRPT